MAYLVIAVGLLTSLAGGYLLNYGYAIVQVERGWSSVIAGAVFVSGGLVTMGLGLLLRAIADVRRSLVGDMRRSLVEGQAVGMSATRADAGFAYPELKGTAIGTIAVPSATGTAEPSFASRDVDLYALSIADELLPREPALGAGDRHDEHHEAPREADAPTEHGDRHAVDVAPTSPHGPQHGDDATTDAGGSQLAVATRDGAAEAPAMDDWLDRAFSDIDGERPHAPAGIAVAQGADAYGTDDLRLRTSRYEAKSARVEPTHVDLVHAEPSHAEPGPAPAYAEPVRPRPPSPDAHPQDSPVIGRYESDGTSYVMYADGSIEAQSPAGVYRFSSMAELKAFIEG